jgi:hypothetical protein
MTIQYINVGTNANDGTGEDLRSAFFKVNSNFQYLAGLGGETNAGQNIGSGSGIYATKSGTLLQFKSLVAGAGVSITPDTSVITISSTAAQPNTISRIIGNSGSWDITQPNSTLQILGTPGSKASTTVSGNQVYITSNFSVVEDATPTLGASLDLNGFDIGNIGPNSDEPTTGNINITGYIKADTLTIGRPYAGHPNPGTVTLNANLTVGGTTQLSSLDATSINVSGGTLTASTITATSINASTIGNVIGSSNVYGTLVGNINSLYNNTVEVLNTDGPNATFTGNVVGSISGNITGSIVTPGLNLNNSTISGIGSITIDGNSSSPIVPFTVISNYRSSPENPALPRALADGPLSAVFAVQQQTDFGFNEAIRLRSYQTNGTQGRFLGAGIMFESTNNIVDNTIPDLDPEYIFHGFVSMQSYTSPDWSDFVVRTRTSVPLQEFDVLVASGDGRVHASGITIDANIISNRLLNYNSSFVSSPINLDLILTNYASGKYVNFYDAYKFPKTIGSPGQVLTVPAPGSKLLTWTTPSGGGGGGGGATYFTNLLDVPQTYLPSDAEKLVRVKATYDGLEFTSNITATVTGSLVGNASTATRLETSRTINGQSFNGTANITFGTDAVSEGSTNQYYTDTRARNSVSVTPSKSLTYTTNTGVFDLAESTAATGSTLVKRDPSGKIHALTVYTDTISVDAALSITVANNLTGNFNVNTSGVVSATNFVTTGTGDPTIESAGKIILDPTTYIDVSSSKISNLATPTVSTDASTKGYVDTAVGTVDTAAVKSNIYTADSGGPITVTKGSTLTVEGGTNITTVASSNKITVNLDSTLTNISISGNLPASGNITSTGGYLKAGNIKIDGDAVTQTQTSSDLNLVPGAGGAVAIASYFNLVGSTMAISGYDTLPIPVGTTPVAINLTTNITFVRTLDWTGSVGGLAYATIDAGREGQIKTIILETRGVYGDALDTRPRYLVLGGNINGASRQVNIGTVDPNGSATFIYLNYYWWRISQVA